MNPLVREHRRRSALAKRLAIFVAPIMLASAGVVAPSIHGHRKSLELLESEQQSLNDGMHMRDDVMQFIALRKDALESAESEIEELLPITALPVDYRERTRQRIESLCQEIVAIETLPREPIVDEVGVPLFPDPYLVAERAAVDVRVRFENLTEFLRRLESESSTVLIEEFAMNRSETALGVVDVHCLLTYLRRAEPPVEEATEYTEEG